MIGKPQWFERRKYGGWGINPKTWQGWVYMAVIIIPYVIFQALPIWNIEIRIIVTGVWILFLLIEVTSIMLRIKQDERERIHEAIAERNALWVIMLVFIIAILFEAAQSIGTARIQVDPFLIAALVLGLIVKLISNVYLDRKD